MPGTPRTGRPTTARGRRLTRAARTAVVAAFAALALVLTPGALPLGPATAFAQAASGHPADAAVTIVNSDPAGDQLSRFDMDGNSLDAHDGSVLKAGAFVYERATGGKSCDHTTFGDDPLWGVAKSCYLAPPGTPPGGWTACAAEDGVCAVTGPQTVAFGAGGSFVTLRADGPTGCTPAVFGADPAPGMPESCDVRTGPPPGYGTPCAAENGTCAFGDAFRTVAFGAGGEFAYRSFTGQTPCDQAAFGTDPIPGTVKSCYLTP